MKIAIKILIILVIAAGIWLVVQALSDAGNPAAETNQEQMMRGVVVQTMPESINVVFGVQTIEEASRREPTTIKFDTNTKFEEIALEQFEAPVVLPGNISLIKPGVEVQVTLAAGSDDLAAVIGVRQYLDPVVPPGSQ